MTDEPKRPAAVVWMERPDGRVLALTRGDDFADWHLPGGKWEEVDGYEAKSVGGLQQVDIMPNLRATACRELSEETGVHLEPASLRVVTDYVTRSGRLVAAFVAPRPSWVPDRFPRYPEGQPAWVPPSMLSLPSCSFGVEFLGLQRAVMAERLVKPADAHDDPR